MAKTNAAPKTTTPPTDPVGSAVHDNDPSGDPDAPVEPLPFPVPKAPKVQDEPAPTGEIVTYKLVHVLIERDANVRMPSTVFEWEVPVLMAIHGEENVHETEEEDDLTIPEMTASQAWYAMLRKYKQHEDAVKSNYPTPQRLRSYGLDFNRGDNLDPRGKGSLVIDHRKAARAKS